jgi:hypothetical protein
MTKRIKKIAIILSLLSVTTMSNASYMVMYGDKQINGDNIKFVTHDSGSGTGPVDPPPASGKECSTRDTPSTEASWTAGSPSYGVLALSWGGVQISVDGDYLATEKIIDGYKYTRGDDLVGGSGSSSTYTICRIKI